MMEIVISQNENQNIRVENNSIQNIGITQDDNQNINIQNKPPQELDIEQGRNQTILIDGGGIVYGITDIFVNGVSVVTDNIAYILVPTKTSELQNNSGFITNETDPTVPSYVKAISLADINNWNNKQDELISGSTIKTINNTSLLGSGNIEIGGENYIAGYGIDITENEISNTIVSYNDLEDLPEIPTKTSDLINDSDYVTENELSDVAFSGSYADLSNIPVIPDSTSELVNDSGFINKNVNDLTYYTPTADLGAVALSNSYNDLDNKPTIPTVNNGTLTIQQNGTNVETFTANSSTNKTANITVPTKTSDLTNDSGYITNNYEIYSNTETRIGTWINNKPIYRKVINFGSSDLNTGKAHGITNIDLITNATGIIHHSYGWKPLTVFYINNNTLEGYFSVALYGIDGTNFEIRAGDWYTTGGTTVQNDSFVVIEYTKTTD